MKDKGILHAQLSAVIAGLGHGESVVIADYGLPIPGHVSLIDLAVSENVPTVEQVLRTVLSELVLETVILTSELEERNREHYEQLIKLCGVPVSTVNHDTFKRSLADVRAVVRTGDWMSFSNIRLIAGVPF